MPPNDRKPAPLPPERQLVLFLVGDVLYGLPIERVREVINPQPVVSLPHSPPAIGGVTDYRGEVVPVLDLRVRFGVVPRRDADALRRVKWILVDVGEPATPQLVATVVDAVEDVHRTRDPLRPAPPLGGGEDDRGIAGVLQRSSQGGGSRGSASAALVFVLDVDRLRALTAPLLARAVEERAS
jgi:purine-binding chemotaxis protein CheW